jgi:ribonuclease P protein component
MKFNMCVDASSIIFHPSSFSSMNRSFSLRTADFQRVWDDGKSYSHPLVILRARANGMEQCRFGFVAGKKMGKATKRNRAKRLLREALRLRLPTIAPGWDIIVIARSGAEQATFQDIDTAIENLLQRAKLEISNRK